jgi:hypothetical protein
LSLACDQFWPGGRTALWQPDMRVAVSPSLEMGGGVESLTTTESGILWAFKKMRLSTPKTADQFKTRTIALGPDGWTIIDDGRAGAGPMAKGADKTEIEILKTETLRTYHRLAPHPM